MFFAHTDLKCDNCCEILMFITYLLFIQQSKLKKYIYEKGMDFSFILFSHTKIFHCCTSNDYATKDHHQYGVFHRREVRQSWNVKLTAHIPVVVIKRYMYSN